MWSPTSHVWPPSRSVFEGWGVGKPRFARGAGGSSGVQGGWRTRGCGPVREKKRQGRGKGRVRSHCGSSNFLFKRHIIHTCVEGLVFSSDGGRRPLRDRCHQQSGARFQPRGIKRLDKKNSQKTSPPAKARWILSKKWLLSQKAHGSTTTFGFSTHSSHSVA